MMQHKRKNSEIQMFQVQGVAYFRTDLRRLAHKILILKSNFKLLARIWSSLSPSKRLANLYFSKKESIFL